MFRSDIEFLFLGLGYEGNPRIGKSTTGNPKPEAEKLALHLQESKYEGLCSGVESRWF